MTWQKCFELEGGQPTGRWQWVIAGAEHDYYYPGAWLDPEAFVPPLSIQADQALEMELQ